MIHSDVFDRFVEESPVSVMTQALLENVLSPSTVDSLFQQHAQSQYARELLFSDIVLLMSLVVCRIKSSLNTVWVRSGWHGDRLASFRQKGRDWLRFVKTG